MSNLFGRDMKDILDGPRRPSKKINPILLREVDVHNVVSAIYNLPNDPHVPKLRHSYAKIKYIANVLLTYTGQRPDVTISKLTFQDLEEALSRFYPFVDI